MEENVKKFGHCLECKRLLPIEFLERVQYYNGHLVEGAYHHQLLCRACEEKAEEVFGESYKGIPLSKLKVGGTD